MTKTQPPAKKREGEIQIRDIAFNMKYNHKIHFFQGNMLFLTDLTYMPHVKR